MRLRTIVLAGLALPALVTFAVCLVWAVQGIVWLTSNGANDEPQLSASAPRVTTLRSAGTEATRAPLADSPPSTVGEQPPVPQRTRMNRGARAALTRDVAAAMRELRPRLEACPDQHLVMNAAPTAGQMKLMEIVQRQIASGGDGEIPQTPFPGATDERGGTELPTILMVDIQTFDSQIKILDVALAMRGAATEAFVACAQRILRGQILFAPAAATGDRLRIPVDLSNPTLESAPQKHATRRRR